MQPLRWYFMQGLSLYAFTAVAPAQVDNLIKNPGFEQSPDGPSHWVLAQHTGVDSYYMELDRNQFTEGEQSFRIQRHTDQIYGIVKQIVRLEPGAGDTIYLSARMRSAGTDGQGWVMTVNFLNGFKNILDTAHSAPLLGDQDWREVKLQRAMPEGTAMLDVGFMLLGGGTGWVDDVHLSLTDPALEQVTGGDSAGEGGDE